MLTYSLGHGAQVSANVFQFTMHVLFPVNTHSGEELCTQTVRQTHACTHTRTHAYTHTHTHTYSHIHTHTHIHAHTQRHVHTHMYTHKNTHTQTRTHTPHTCTTYKYTPNPHNQAGTQGNITKGLRGWGEGGEAGVGRGQLKENKEMGGLTVTVYSAHVHFLHKVCSFFPR